jgi:CSLREA domain-containing protein
VLLLALSATARAATITVNITADALDPNDGRCSLREAVIAANADTASGAVPGECPAGFGSDTSNLPAGTFTLTLIGVNGDGAFTGDLDLKGHVVITGVGAAHAGSGTVIDANGIDRAVDVQPGAVASTRSSRSRTDACACDRAASAATSPARA